MAKGKNFSGNDSIQKQVGKSLMGSAAPSSLFSKSKDKEEGEENKSSNVATVAIKSAIRPLLIKISIIAAVVLILILLLTVIVGATDIFSWDQKHPLNDMIEEVRNEYAQEYNVSIDAKMIIAALVAEQDVEVYNDVDDVEDEVRLLAKYQIVTHTDGNCASDTKRQIASNDDSGLFSSDVSDEKNYECDPSREHTYYSVSVEKGDYDDDNSGSAFFWNLVDEDFIFDYYQDYMPGDRNSPETQEKIEIIVRKIYSYYNDVAKYFDDNNDIFIGFNCEAVTVDKSSDGNYGNVDDAENGKIYLDLDDYVLGVILAGNASDAYTKLGSNSEALLNYYKALAVTVRSYTVAKTKDCANPIVDSTAGQVYDNPSYYSSTQYYSLVEQAVKDTAGEILINDYQVLMAQYDDFDKTGAYTCDGGYCTNIYTKLPGYQKHIVRVPENWVNDSSITGTGKGLSKYGAMYLAQEGYDYSNIISTFFSDNVQFSNVGELPANYEVAGDYSTWRQIGASWSNQPLGNSTIGRIGCACTSIAIQIARSGTELRNTTVFDPGVLVSSLTRAGYIDRSGNVTWAGPQNSIAPYFVYSGQQYLTGSATEKAQKLQEYLRQGYYMILAVKYKGNGDYGHYVALDRVSNNVIYIFDPAGRGTILYDAYPNDNKSSTPLRVIMYKRMD